MRVVAATSDLVRFLAARFSPGDQALLEERGSEEVLSSLEDAVRGASRTWCGFDAGGPVLLLIATPLADFPAAMLWFVSSGAVFQNWRDCIRLWRRAVDEMLAEFGTVYADVPGWLPSLRRMARYGFAIEALPGGPVEGPGVYRCRLTQMVPNSGFYLHQSAAAS